MPRAKTTTPASAPARSKIASDAATPRTAKSSALLALLARDQGASIGDIVAATGWIPHTARAALTGLRKKGHAIARVREADVTAYRLLEQVQ